jgi:hypothetical protein
LKFEHRPLKKGRKRERGSRSMGLGGTIAID